MLETLLMLIGKLQKVISKSDWTLARLEKTQLLCALSAIHLPFFYFASFLVQSGLDK